MGWKEERETLQQLDIDITELVTELNDSYKRRDENFTAFTRVKTTDDYIMSCCPYHSERRPSFGILKSFPYQFNCFTCGAKGNLIDLIAHSLKLAHPDALKWLTKSYKLFFSENPFIDLAKLFGDDSSSKPILDPAILKAYDTIHPWMLKRGFTEDVLRRFSIGYDPTIDAITIPIWDYKGNLRYIKKRLVNPPPGVDKYYNVKHVEKKDIVYLIHFIKNAGIREVFVMEGEFNALSCYQMGMPPVSIGTSKITDAQATILLKAGIKHVHLFYDNDDAGRSGIEQTYEKLSPYMVVDKVVFPREFNDANDMLKAGVLNTHNISIRPCRKFQVKV